MKKNYESLFSIGLISPICSQSNRKKFKKDYPNLINIITITGNMEEILNKQLLICKSLLVNIAPPVNVVVLPIKEQ